MNIPDDFTPQIWRLEAGAPDNLYLQYFSGLPGCQEDAPFDASTLVLFCKRISAECNVNRGTLTLDAICVLTNIRYPQDISLLFTVFVNYMVCRY